MRPQLLSMTTARNQADRTPLLAWLAAGVIAAEVVAILATFGERLRGQVDLDEILHEVTTSVGLAVRPEREALWLRRMGE